MFITVFSTCYTVTCHRNFWTCINMFIKWFLGVCRMFGMCLTHVLQVFVQILDTSTFLRIDFTRIYPCLALFGKVWHKFGMSLALISYFYLNVIMTFAFSLNLRWVLSSPTLMYQYSLTENDFLLPCHESRILNLIYVVAKDHYRSGK